MDDIFNTSQEQTNTEIKNDNAAPSAQVDIFVEKLMGITREDGSPKYESVEQALDALKVSQEHIARIERENAEYRTRAEQADHLKETLEKLKRDNNMSDVKPLDDQSNKGGLSKEEAAKIAEQTWEQKKQEETAISNIKTVQDAIIQRVGSREKAQEFVLNKAKELGISAERLKYISAESPNAALALLGESVKTPTTPNISSVRVPNSPSTEELKAPDVSILSGRGATGRNQIDHLRRVKEKVYKEHGLT